MKVLVTGSKGRIGSKFIDLYGDKYDIISYDIQDGKDILNFNQVKEAAAACERIVHLAAIPAPREGRTFEEYFKLNCEGTRIICEAAAALKTPRLIYASSTTYYGIERGIPFKTPIKEDQPVLSQYIRADDLKCRDIDLYYHHSKVIAEQIVADYSMLKKFEAVVLRFAPVGKVFFNTSVSFENACHAIDCAITAKGPFWYEPFSIVDPGLAHISHEKATKILGYQPAIAHYAPDQIH